ncbi:MAG: sulfatase-like hydrolase/transferase, partial [Planctomycetota bacterium]|nr:sulfatase-like hydrolase/transferase [Planctomycetota bacterium]
MLTVAVVAGAGAWGAWRYVHRSPAAIEGVRNVVLISIDTCRAERLSCYGYKRPTTPNIDAVAREGVLFRHALTPIPETTPAHASMLTGTCPLTHGVRENGSRMADSNVTLAKILREAGYRTGGFVGGFPLDARFGLNQGFDVYDSRFTQTTWKATSATERRAEDVNRPAMAWLDKNAGKPFFLFLHYYDVHEPYGPPAPYSTDYAGDLYAGEVAYVDHCIGQVMDRLKAAGAYENTLVIITADHGESLGEHGEKTHGYFMYQSVMHVPLVIRAPGARRGVAAEENVSLVDIVPTVLDLVGLKAPARVQGESLRRALEGDKPTPRRQGVYGEAMVPASSFGCSPLNGIVEGSWKYIRAPRQELYDLRGDAGEQNNLAEKEPAVARRLRDRMEAMLQEMESHAVGPGGSTVDAEAIRKLQGLGYMAAGGGAVTSAFDSRREDPKDFLPIFHRIQLATGLAGAGRREEAARECVEILKDRPALMSPRLLLFQIALADHRMADARTLADQLIALGTGGGDSAKGTTRPAVDTMSVTLCLTELGQALAAEGKTQEALIEFENALRIDPGLRDPRYYLGVIAQRQGKLDEAIAQYRKALQIDPGFANAWNNLGAALRGQNKPQEAADCFAKALEADPDHADAHYNLAAFLQQTGKLPEAIEHYEQALRINPDLAKTTNLT